MNTIQITLTALNNIDPIFSYVSEVKKEINIVKESLNKASTDNYFFQNKSLSFFYYSLHWLTFLYLRLSKSKKILISQLIIILNFWKRKYINNINFI